MNRFIDIDLKSTAGLSISNYENQKIVSLEQALEPVRSCISNLCFHINTAKTRCQYPGKHGLTLDEAAAIYLYTMEWGDSSLYRVLNTVLRSQDREQSEKWFPFLKLLSSAADKLPQVKQCIWRGITGDHSKDLKENQIIVWSGFSSCSNSINVIKDFLRSNKCWLMDWFVVRHSTLFMIEAHDGRSLSGYTKYSYENEVLLMPNTKLRVVSNALSHESGLHIVHLAAILPEQPVKRTDPKPKNTCSGVLFAISVFPLILYLLWRCSADLV